MAQVHLQLELSAKNFSNFGKEQAASGRVYAVLIRVVTLLYISSFYSLSFKHFMEQR